VQNSSSGPLSNARSNNTNLSLNANTSLTARTSASAGIGYTMSETPGTTNTGNTSAFNVFATINHAF